MIDNLIFEKINSENLDLAIKVQNEIFPEENGAINLKLSIDKNLIKEIFGDIKKYRETSNYWLCKYQNKIIGITGIYSYFEYPNDAWVGWFGVLSEHRGLGFGKQILIWTMSQAKKMGFKNLRLYTDLDNNKTAVELYRKVNMIEESYLGEDMSPEKIIIFSKSLSSSKTEKFGDKNLFLKEQENVQQLANF